TAALARRLAAAPGRQPLARRRVCASRPMTTVPSRSSERWCPLTSCRPNGPGAVGILPTPPAIAGASVSSLFARFGERSGAPYADRMRIDNEFTVGAPLEQAWAVLTDLEGIAPCMPGAVLTGRDGETYSGKVKIKVGPVSSEYAGTASFVEKDD